MKNLLLLLVIAASIWAGIALDRAGWTIPHSSFGNFKGALLASLLDTYSDIPGFCEFSAPSPRQTSNKKLIDAIVASMSRVGPCA